MNVSTATSMASVLADGRALREKQAQDRADAKLRDARSAVETLKQRNSAAANDAQEQRKAAAKQKVEQLKARIRMLQMSGSIDPKMLAQLARELKSAVKAYSGAGGSATELGGGASGSTAANAEPTPSVETAAGAAGAAEDTGTDQAAAPSEPLPVPGDQKAGVEGEKNPEAAKPDDNPYRRMAEAAQMRVAEQARHGAAQQADRDFLSDVRNLANQIKTMAKRAQQQAQTDPGLRHQADQADQAATEALRAIEDAGGDLGATGVSLTV